VILTLTFSLTIFTAVEAQTYYEHHTKQIDYYLGGDIRIFSPFTPAPRVQEIRNLPGIENATSFIEVRANYLGVDFRLFGVNPEVYAEVGYWDETSIVNDDFQSVMSALAADHFSIVLPQHLSNTFNKHVGDNIQLTVYDQNIIPLHPINVPQTFEVVGEFFSAPGFGYGNPSEPGASVVTPAGFGFQEDNAFAFVHEDYFLEEVPLYETYDYVNMTQTFIASIEPGADINEVIDEVDDLDFAAIIWSPYTFNLDDVYPSGYLFSQGVVSLLSVGFCASLIISVIALVVFVSTIVAERKVEYAIMRAIGGTRGQVTAIVIGEFSGLILSAFLFSIVLGAGFSILMINTLINLYPQPSILPYQIIWPTTLLLVVLGVVILGMLLGAYLPARRAGSVQVSRLLRNL
jgi:ABC-type antimicrobial peptide transport system permease subunit